MTWPNSTVLAFNILQERSVKLIAMLTAVCFFSTGCATTSRQQHWAQDPKTGEIVELEKAPPEDPNKVWKAIGGALVIAGGLYLVTKGLRGHGSGKTCYYGPNGGTYTRTSTGGINYSGC